MSRIIYYPQELATLGVRQEAATVGVSGKGGAANGA